jgi:hypothetical protein
MNTQPIRNSDATTGRTPINSFEIATGKHQSRRSFWLRVALFTSCFLFVTVGSVFVAAQQPPLPPAIIGDKYADLLPEQKVLVDDWFKRFGEVVKKPVSAQEGYDNLPLSTKTTFGAVTHALLRTTLTDQAGTPLGTSAMALVDKLETVAGKIEGGSGDTQFRIYILLKPNALDILAKSREFGRGPDNIVFHKGYPICYRSKSGTPSLQVSATKDGKRADIDVDYRSSKFPAFLVNGHLSASNSDVRAGNNDERHNGQWAGLSSWWRGFLGLPLLERGNESEDWPTKEPALKANVKPEVAVHDFLKSWLVDQRPDLAAPYFGESSFRCREVEGGPGRRRRNGKILSDDGAQAGQPKNWKRCRRFRMRSKASSSPVPEARSFHNPTNRNLFFTMSAKILPSR